MTTVTLPRLLTAAAIGIVYYRVLVLMWGHIGVHDPFNQVLLDAVARHGNPIPYRIIMSLRDAIANLLVAFPFAAVFRFLPALRSWTYVTLAAATSVIAGYASINMEALPILLGNWLFWFGFALAAFSLPVAFFLLNRMGFGGVPASRVQDAA